MKDAIERSYQKVGWDLRNSESVKGVFPVSYTHLVLSGVNWELQLNATHDSIVFVDEGSTFVSSLDFARAKIGRAHV